jgi:hypothetical protein
MNEDLDMPFLQLVLSLQAGAMQHLGKIVSPATGKVERDLAMAQGTINLLEMLERKTRGNLTKDEADLLQHVLYELRLNYVDEQSKETVETSSGQGDQGGKA